MAAPLTTRVVRKHGREVRLVRTCLLDVIAGPDAGRQTRIARPVYHVGTHPSNDLQLADETVSKEHLEIAALPEGFRVTDLSSSNGTFLGGVRLGEVTLTQAATLQLGATSLRLEPLDEEAEVPSSTRRQFGAVLGCSVTMRELFAQLENVSQSDCSLLLEGETGVGKELVAESLHQESGRAAGPFVVVDCGALAGELIESELFGHVRGAFSSADRERRGLLEAANGGTLFLDEVGELPLALQVKLLGALERKRVTPLGAAAARPIDVRVVAATNRDLSREVNAGRFRADLFYRLAVVRLRIPPLRERLDDLPLLANAFLTALRPRYGDALPSELSALTLARLAAQPWPGNVRELRNAVARVALLAVEKPRPAAAPPAYVELRDRFMADFDHRYLLRMLERSDFNVTRAAQAAGLKRTYFQRLLNKSGISAAELRRR
jgi:transcriptional regulator with GAF, ATPase, and Fis domain